MNKLSTGTKTSGVEHKMFFEPIGFMITLLFAALTIYVSSLAYYSIISSDDYYTGTITVSGRAELEAKPDVQKLSIDIEGTSTSTPEYAKKIVIYLKSKGVTDLDIKIPSVKTLVVKLRGNNMANADKIAADIEKISSKYITPTLEDPKVENVEKIKSRALDMALNNAKMNALKVSQSLGADLGKVVSYYDTNDQGGGYDDYTSDSSSLDNMVSSDISVTFQTR